MTAVVCEQLHVKVVSSSVRQEVAYLLTVSVTVRLTVPTALMRLNVVSQKNQPFSSVHFGRNF